MEREAVNHHDVIVIGASAGGVDIVQQLAAGLPRDLPAAVFIAMSLVAETGSRLAATGYDMKTFVSPNVEGIQKDHNFRVFDEYARRWFERPPDPVIR